MYDEDFKKRNLTLDVLKNAFPYYLPNDNDGNGVFYSAHVGTSDQYNVLIRINFQYQGTKPPVIATFGVVDDDRQQFLYNNIEGLKKKVSDIIKARIDKDTKRRKDEMQADMESMLLCGFLTRNDLSYSTEKFNAYVVVNIFGTAFEKLPVHIYKNNPNVYVIPTPRASFNQSQLESFILNCKSLKEWYEERTVKRFV